MTKSIATLMQPSEQAVNRRDHCNVFAMIVDQNQLREGLWEIDVEIATPGPKTTHKLYFDKAIDLEGRQAPIIICVRHADECEVKYQDEAETTRTAYYFFILDVVLVSEGTNTSFQAEHFRN